MLLTHPISREKSSQASTYGTCVKIKRERKGTSCERGCQRLSQTMVPSRQPRCNTVLTAACSIWCSVQSHDTFTHMREHTSTFCLAYPAEISPARRHTTHHHMYTFHSFLMVPVCLSHSGLRDFSQIDRYAIRYL